MASNEEGKVGEGDVKDLWNLEEDEKAEIQKKCKEKKLNKNFGECGLYYRPLFAIRATIHAISWQIKAE